MNRVQIRSIFDRKKEASSKKKGLLQIEIRYEKNASSSLPALNYTKTSIEVDV